MLYSRRSCRSALALVFSLLTAVSGAAHAADLRAMNALLDAVLSDCVEDGYVDYPAIARNVRFHKYLEVIADFDAGALASDHERLAFWINAYNALAIKSVIDGVRPIDALGRLSFFRTTEHRVGGRELDLQSIADEIVAPLGEPRARLALVPASYSAPKLRAEAYRVDSLDEQLDANTRDFINDNRKNRFSAVSGKAKLSKIFDRNEDEFGGDAEAVLAFVADYVSDPGHAEALRSGRYKLEYLEYDWSINGRPL